MAQVAALIANDHEDEATRLFRHGWMLYQQVKQAPPNAPAQPAKLLNCPPQLPPHDASVQPERCHHTFQVLNNDYLEHKRLYAAVQSVLAAEAQRGPFDVLVSCCTSSPAPMLLCASLV